MRTRGIVVGVATGAVLIAGATLAVGASTATAALATTTGPQARQTNVLDAGPDTRVQQDVLSIVNEQRRFRGCPELWLDDRLMDAARTHAAEMANHVYFDHESLAGETAGERVEETGYDWWSYAENIARGQDSPDEVVQDWMDSPPHRDNILNCSLREVGVGLAFDTANTPYWVQDFATES
jgi:uncharacterized protein YkwD